MSRPKKVSSAEEWRRAGLPPEVLSEELAAEKRIRTSIEVKKAVESLIDRGLPREGVNSIIKNAPGIISDFKLRVGGATLAERRKRDRKLAALFRRAIPLLESYGGGGEAHFLVFMSAIAESVKPDDPTLPLPWPLAKMLNLYVFWLTNAGSFSPYQNIQAGRPRKAKGPSGLTIYAVQRIHFSLIELGKREGIRRSQTGFGVPSYNQETAAIVSALLSKKITPNFVCKNS